MNLKGSGIIFYKKYKPTFGIATLHSALPAIVAFTISGFVILLFLSLMYFLDATLLLIPLSFPLMYIIWIIIIFIVNIICRIFCKTQFIIDGDFIIYGEKTIPIHCIKYITLDMGFVSRHSSRPHSMSLFYDDNALIYIDRPSISFLHCLKTKYGVDIRFERDLQEEFLSDLKIYFALVAFVVVLMIICTIAGCE